MKSRQLVEDCCFEENLLGDADTPVGTIHSCYDTATAVACSNRFSSMRYNLLQVECGLWVPVDFRTIGHLIPDCTKHYRRSSRTYLERTAMGAVGDCTVLILRDFGCCVSHSSVLIVRPLSMAATSRWLIDVSFCRAIFFV